MASDRDWAISEHTPPPSLAALAALARTIPHPDPDRMTRRARSRRTRPSGSPALDLAKRIMSWTIVA